MPYQRTARALAALAVLALLAVPAAAGDSGCQESFEHFVAGWCAGDAAAVVQCLEKEGSVRLKLLAPPGAESKPIDGTMKRDNAKKALKEYFAHVELIKPILKDVTPKDKREGSVRNYDYTYRPVGQDPVATRLSVVLKKDDSETWRLSSVTESVLPR